MHTNRKWLKNKQSKSREREKNMNREREQRLHMNNFIGALLREKIVKHGIKDKIISKRLWKTTAAFQAIRRAKERRQANNRFLLCTIQTRL